MNAGDRDRILIELHTNMDYIKKAVDEHGQKLDKVMPAVASQKESLKWMKITGGTAFGVVGTAMGVMWEMLRSK